MSQTTHLGTSMTIVTHPASSTHVSLGFLGLEELEKAGIRPNMIRVSVGLEAETDLLEEIERALGGLA